MYWFDQLLKGRITPEMRVLDAGCGSGRNLEYLLRSGQDVSGVDVAERAVAAVRRLARELAPDLATDRFRVEAVDAMSFRDAEFDVVLSSAVLHFAADEAHFDRMLHEMWRVLSPGGLLVVRLASSIGIEAHVVPREGGRYLLPDGSERFLVDEALLLDRTRALGGRLAEPIKTTNVQNLRCMTTWCVAKAE